LLSSGHVLKKKLKLKINSHQYTFKKKEFMEGISFDVYCECDNANRGGKVTFRVKSDTKMGQVIHNCRKYFNIGNTEIEVSCRALNNVETGYLLDPKKTVSDYKIRHGEIITISAIKT
jgi:hypothetical protein